MARRHRIEFPGALYHVTARGNHGDDIYRDDHDRYLWSQVLAQVVAQMGWHCHSYCQMGNHFHLLVETPTANLAQGMRQLNGIYTQKFNFHHQTYGHVYQGRYGAVVVERDRHLLELCRYIALNPARAGLVTTPDAWRWSSYRATLGEVPVPSWLDVDRTRGLFATIDDFRAFVLAGLKQPLPETGLSAPQVEKAFARLSRPALAALKTAAPDREAWMVAAHVTHGYRLREIAAFEKVDPSVISRVIARWKRRA